MARKLSSTVTILAKSTEQRLRIGNVGVQAIEHIMLTCDFSDELLVFGGSPHAFRAPDTTFEPSFAIAIASPMLNPKDIVPHSRSRRG